MYVSSADCYVFWIVVDKKCVWSPDSKILPEIMSRESREMSWRGESLVQKRAAGVELTISRIE